MSGVVVAVAVVVVVMVGRPREGAKGGWAGPLGGCEAALDGWHAVARREWAGRVEKSVAAVRAGLLSRRRGAAERGRGRGRRRRRRRGRQRSRGEQARSSRRAGADVQPSGSSSLRCLVGGWRRGQGRLVRVRMPHPASVAVGGSPTKTKNAGQRASELRRRLEVASLSHRRGRFKTFTAPATQWLWRVARGRLWPGARGPGHMQLGATGMLCHGARVRAAAGCWGTAAARAGPIVAAGPAKLRISLDPCASRLEDLVPTCITYMTMGAGEGRRPVNVPQRGRAIQ